MNKLNITFERFRLDWKFHTIQLKLDKARCELEWDRCISNDLKSKAIEDIKDYKSTHLTALEYLRLKLNNYGL